jgi:hypothetical protein
MLPTACHPADRPEPLKEMPTRSAALVFVDNILYEAAAEHGHIVATAVELALSARLHPTNLKYSTRTGPKNIFNSALRSLKRWTAI